MVVVLTIFGKTNRSKALIVKGAVVAATQIAVATEDKLGRKLAEIVGIGDGLNIAGQLAGRGIIFAAYRANAAQVSIGSGSGNPLRENADPIAILVGVAGSFV